MKSNSTAYSGTPLVKKLGIKTSYKILLHNTPKNYLGLFTEWPEGIVFLRDNTSESADFIHAFCTTNDELQEITEKLKPSLKKSGMLWISWPKGSSPMPTTLSRDYIREYFLGNGLVDVKVAAIDKDWSGLKFVYRLKDR
jgi:hypothetical protein